MCARTSQLAALVSFLHADATSSMRGDDYGVQATSTPPLKPSLSSTHEGCTCQTECGTNAREERSECDWCYVIGNCGTSGYKGNWDYCTYPTQKPWEAQNYNDKTKQLWSRITDPSVVDQSGPAQGLSGAQNFVDIISTSMITAFDDQWDVMPTGRSKVIHAQGVMCQFELEVQSNSPFTGVLSPGKQSGLIRLGSASSLDGLHPPHVPTIFPGFGIKFLRSGVRSANWVSLRQTGPGGSYNFFDSAFSNHVAPDQALINLGKFQQASGCIDSVGLSDACTYTQAGEKVDKPVFPFELWFEPTGSVSFADTKKSNSDLLAELAGIPDGSEVFSVHAFMSPADKKQGKQTTIGKLTSKGTCHQSKFGDLDLFFRHQRMEEDFAQRTEWIPQMAALGQSACAATTGPIAQWQCPHISDQTEIV